MKIDNDAAYKAEIERLNKVITVLCDRAELGVNSKSSDFSMFQTTVILEEKVRVRTAELKEALDSLAISNQELDHSLNELRRTQQELVESQKMASLAGLVMGVAHELNTPLGVAITTVSMIEQGCLRISDAVEKNQLTRTFLDSSLVELSEAVKLVSSSLSKSNYLVAQFKQVSAIRGNAHLINLPEYIKELCVVMTEQLAQPNLSIDVRCDAENFDCLLDDAALHSVLSSLIHNSSQHAFEGQLSPKIEISVMLASEEVEIVYRDNGCGFDAEIVDKIFDPFFTTARSSGSTGLGLHIVFNIVSVALGGVITLTEWSDGAAFTIRFPRMVKP